MIFYILYVIFYAVVIIFFKQKVNKLRSSETSSKKIEFTYEFVTDNIKKEIVLKIFLYFTLLSIIGFLLLFNHGINVFSTYLLVLNTIIVLILSILIAYFTKYKKTRGIYKSYSVLHYLIPFAFLVILETGIVENKWIFFYFIAELLIIIYYTIIKNNIIYSNNVHGQRIKNIFLTILILMIVLFPMFYFMINWFFFPTLIIYVAIFVILAIAAHYYVKNDDLNK